MSKHTPRYPDSPWRHRLCRVWTVLAEDQSSVPSTYPRRLTTACNSSSGRNWILLASQGTCTHTHNLPILYIQSIKIKINVWECKKFWGRNPFLWYVRQLATLPFHCSLLCPECSAYHQSHLPEKQGMLGVQDELYWGFGRETGKAGLRFYSLC